MARGSRDLLSIIEADRSELPGRPGHAGAGLGLEEPQLLEGEDARAPRLPQDDDVPVRPRRRRQPVLVRVDVEGEGDVEGSDAKEVDQQAAVEATLSCATSIMSGANLIHDIGLLDHAEIASPEMMVLCDEIIAMLRAALQEIEVNDETLALDLIHEVGPGGHFLAEEHTLANFRKVWYPTMMDRSRLGTHAARELVSFTERLNRKTRVIIETHRPEPLPKEVQDEFRRRQKAWTG